ncbi:MAG: NIPSNAP family protein [Geminicoccaceae bacterium]
MRYEIASLTVRLGGTPAVVAGIDAHVKAPKAMGTLLGCFVSEIGELNRVILLRGFADDAQMQAERARIHASDNPFGAGEAITAMEFTGYAPYGFSPPVVPGRFGPVYEIRTYRLKHGCLPRVEEVWGPVIPARTAISPLTVAMHAIEGVPRFTHIWPFASLDDRAAKRAQSVAEGVWPPPGGPALLTGEMSSLIALPTAISPLT